MTNTTSSKKAIVIGAGIAGLAASIRLRLQGWDVEVYEQNDKPGGKIGEWQKEGFRFDTGPSLFTLPELVDELFEMAGVNPRSYFNYELLRHGTWYFYPDGTALKPGPTTAELSQTLERQTSEKAANIREFLAKSREKYDITKPVFLESSLHKRATYLNIGTFKRFLKLPRIEAFKTMASANAKQFRDERVRQFFNRYATFNGSNPYATPATFNVIPHLEHNLGAYWPEGGMYQLVKAVYQLAADSGVRFHFQQSVSKIDVDKRQAKGVYLGDQIFIPADAVVSNMDVHATYRYLLPGKEWQSRFLNQQRSTSALIFYWGMNKEFPDFDVHNILFSGDYEAEFRALFQEHEIPEDPTVYLFISQKAGETDAPEGCENWYVMINAPYDNGQDWEVLVNKARDRILNKIERIAGYSVKAAIRFEKVRGPKALESETSAYLGSLYGNSSNNLLAAFLRHPNFSPRIKGLYFCGGTVHPGGGIPLCLLSAKIATQIIQEDNLKGKI